MKLLAEPSSFIPQRTENPVAIPEVLAPVRHKRKKRIITEALEHELTQPGVLPDLARSTINQAKRGNTHALSIMLDRVEGPLTQRVAIGPLEYEAMSDEELDLELKRLEHYEES